VRTATLQEHSFKKLGEMKMKITILKLSFVQNSAKFKAENDCVKMDKIGGGGATIKDGRSA
jgi:hypothetical protein